MEYVKRLPESPSHTPQSHMVLQQNTSTPINNGTASVVAADPFHFEPYYSTNDDQAAAAGYDARNIGRYKFKQINVQRDLFSKINLQ